MRQRHVLVPFGTRPEVVKSRIAAILADDRTDALLTLDEPDFTNGRLPWS